MWQETQLYCSIHWLATQPNTLQFTFETHVGHRLLLVLSSQPYSSHAWNLSTLCGSKTRIQPSHECSMQSHSGW